MEILEGGLYFGEKIYDALIRGMNIESYLSNGNQRKHISKILIYAFLGKF